MKFTEEQYQKIVNAWDNADTFKSACKSVIDLVDSYHNFLYQEALAIGNELTREWAREQFVEPEKKYVWTSKKFDKNCIKMHLYKDYFGRVQSFLSVKNVNIDDNEKLTETEIREWGYNPEMFNKEEVK